MPKRGKKAPKRKTGGDKLHYPLLYDFTAAGASVTTLANLVQTFDRRRPFRVAGFYGTITAYKFPIVFQFEVYGVQSTTDNVYTTPVQIVPANGSKRFSRRLPASATGWFPSETAETTRICQLVNICTDKGTMGGLKGVVTLVLALGPYEAKESCPSTQLFVPIQDSDSDSDYSEASDVCPWTS